MIKSHSDEIKELYNLENEHWAIETADRIVLCFELLVTNKKDINEVFSKATPRFFKKLNELSKNS